MKHHILLDPNLYIYTDEEWADNLALDRLDDLLRILTELDESEDALETLERVKFILPEDIMTAAYSKNPHINMPPNNFYFRMYVNQVMPALYHRAAPDIANDETENAIIDELTIDDCEVRDELEFWLAQVDSGEAKEIVYLFHPMRRSIVTGNCFADECSIESTQGRHLIDCCDLFPIDVKNNPSVALIEAVDILHSQLAKADPTWKDFARSGVVLHDEFIPSLRKAKFGAEEGKYRYQIIYSILQTTVSRPVSTFEHSMTPQTIAFDGANHGKWNAYVFRNGPTAEDRRCSRIYFAKIDRGFLLFRYEGDAHS